MIVKKAIKKVHKLIKVLTLLALLCNSAGGAWYNPWIRSLPDKSIKSSPTLQLLSLRSCHWSTLTVPLHLGNLLLLTSVICSSTSFSFYIWFSPLNADTLLTSSTFYISFKLIISFHVFFSRSSRWKTTPGSSSPSITGRHRTNLSHFSKCCFTPQCISQCHQPPFSFFPIQVNIYIFCRCCPVANISSLNFRLKTASPKFVK